MDSLFSGCAWLLLGSSAEARTWVVDAGGDFFTIQEAIDAASDGDTIEVHPYTYREAVNFLGKDLVVIGVDGPDRTTIDSESASAAVTFAGGEPPTAVLEGFTLTSAGGRGLLIEDASPTITDCEVSGNGVEEEGVGGGALVTGASAPRFERVVFDENDADDGGAVAVTSGAAVVFDACTFYGSLTAPANRGGGIFAQDAALTISSSVFDDVDAWREGGTIYAERTIVDIDSSSFDGGGTYRDGGAIYATDDCAITITNSEFIRNSATSGKGGVLYASAASIVRIESTTLMWSFAEHGGAVYALDGVEMAIVDSTILENEAWVGGGLYVLGEPGTTLTTSGATFEGNVGGPGGAYLEDVHWTDDGSVFRANEVYEGTVQYRSAIDGTGATLTETLFEDNASSDFAGALVLANSTGVFVTLDGVSFLRNTAEDDGGAILSWSDGPVVIHRSLFVDNEAGEDGGAMTARAYTSGSVQISESTFTGNYAKYLGGAIRIEEGGAFTVTSSDFVGNANLYSTSGTAAGGAIFVADVSTAWVDNNLFHGNESKYGAAYYQTRAIDGSWVVNNRFSENYNTYGGAAHFAEDTAFHLINNTFFSNTSHGRGTVFLEQAYGEIVNNIVAASTRGSGIWAADYESTSGTFAYNDVWGNYGGDYAGEYWDLSGVDGNISADPLLLSFTADDDPTNDLYTLRVGSPAIDAGDSLLLDVDGSRSDMGAFGGPSLVPIDRDEDGWSLGEGDCDDGDAATYPGATEVSYDGVDGDCDGSDDFDADRDGFASDAYGGTDCLDDDPAAYPGAADTWYDGTDSDCSGGSDYDADGDAYDSDAFGGSDCDDTDSAIRPGASDLWYDGVDSDCGGNDDYDRDRDGHRSAVYGGADCDDAVATVYPGAADVAYDGVDADCAGDDDYDADGDGASSTSFGGTDCDDTRAEVHPEAKEVYYDGVDANCDGWSDNDADRDGFDSATMGGPDCDDADPAVSPDAIESYYDGVDGDCDGASDYDQDRDGFDADAFGGADCDDADETIHPVAVETVDGVDSDCDGLIDDGTEVFDDDGDGFTEEAGDCDDSDAGTYPGASELVDGRDNDCDSDIDEGGGMTDADGDGLSDAEEADLGTNPEDGDTDADGYGDLEEVKDPTNPIDTDQDGLIDALDSDDDGDGLLTVDEDAYDVDGDGSPDSDVDADGVANSRDTDSDGDGIPDAEEGTGDEDGDGVPNFLDPDGSGACGGCDGSRGPRAAWIVGVLAALSAGRSPQSKTPPRASSAYGGCSPGPPAPPSASP